MNQQDLQLTGGNNNGDRRELDFYPTPKNVTVALMQFLDLEPSIIWEPACGNLAMSNVIESFGHTVISTDISIGGGDFFKLTRTCDAIITNPPFSLSEDFIKKALTEARMVAILLKSQYWHAIKRMPLFMDSKPRFILPLTWRPDFLEHERAPGEKKGAPTMEVAWTVWKRGYQNYPEYIPLKKPN